jgi:hypothetical protein
MAETGFLNWLEATWLAEVTRDVIWVFPLFETLHFMGLCVMFGGLLVIDLRVLGIARFIPMRPALSFTPLIIGAFVVVVFTGFAFFASNPFNYAPNTAFRIKMALIVLGGLNALWFWLSKHGKLSSLPDGEQADGTAKLIAALSLFIWAGVIVMGRLIPFLL